MARKTIAKKKKKKKAKKKKNEAKKILAKKQLFEFHEIFPKEVDAINLRRGKFHRTPIGLEDENKDRYGNPVQRPTQESKLVGVALSGGGVRSASFCLGALQALDTLGHLKKVDYLSTVSGGGYIGTSMCAAMSSTESRNFPFPSDLDPDESPGLQHIRDYSNYLFPRGPTSILDFFITWSFICAVCCSASLKC
jgi:predicted acylesterase/phospholipase RssA